MTAPIANGESGSSVRTKLNSIIVEVDGLGTAADYATAAQGATADTALQNGDTFDELIDGTTNKAFTSTEQTKLAGIATGAEVNTINTALAGEPTGSDLVLNAVSLTQAEYDAGTPVATTFYIIT